MKRIAVLPGTFDPVTTGHYDLVKRASVIFDEAIVLVAENSEKRTLFSLSDRTRLCEAAFKDLENVRVLPCEKVVADLANELGAACLVKGARNGYDFSYELQLFGATRSLGAPDTLILPVKPELSAVSSTFVRELLRYGKDYSAYVPKGALELLGSLLKI